MELNGIECNLTEFLMELNETEWKLIGHGPCLSSSWECERKMIKLDSLSTTDKLCFFEFVTEEQDACYLAEFDMKTERIQWTEIGSNKYDPNDPIYDYERYMWWHFYSVQCDLIKFGVNKDKALMIPGVNKCPIQTHYLSWISMKDRKCVE